MRTRDLELVSRGDRSSGAALVPAFKFEVELELE